MHYFTQNTLPNPTTEGTLYRVPSGQDPWVLPAKPDIPPHGRTSATPSPQRMKILTRKYLLGRVAHECRGQYCFISPTQHTMHYLTQNMPTNPIQQETPHIRVPLNARSMGLAGQPGIPPTAAPPEASYRRPEDNIVLSHMPRVTRDAYTKYICVHHFLIGRGTLDRMPLDVRSMGLAGQPGIPPMAAPPLPLHLKG
mgnify:CR=1 FL=1